MILIGLAGPPGAGKKTIARYLQTRHDFERVLFYQNIAPFLRRSIAPGIVFDDVYFEHEATAIRGTGGQIWLVQRPGYLTRAGDRYIGILPAGPDRGVLNAGTLEDLQRRVDTLLAALHLDLARAKVNA